MPISQSQFNDFHRIDRELFTVLTIVLWRDPLEAMQVMALWLWLEKYNLKSIINRMRILPGTIICALVEETGKCLSVLNNEPLAAGGFEIPLLEILLDRAISIEFFQQNRAKFLKGIFDVMLSVCQRAFPEITQQAVEMNMAQGNAPTLREEDKKAIYMTFSRGHPVPEQALQNYLNGTCGENVVESLTMQQVEDNSQPLYAKVVFQNKTTVENILQGRSLVKFVVEENSVWARKLVPSRE
ncbi:hypothetical protein ACFE04_013450 [Oxalis oulophora]